MKIGKLYMETEAVISIIIVLFVFGFLLTVMFISVNNARKNDREQEDRRDERVDEVDRKRFIGLKPSERDYMIYSEIKEVRKLLESGNYGKGTEK